MSDDRLDQHPTETPPAAVRAPPATRGQFFRSLGAAADPTRGKAGTLSRLRQGSLAELLVFGIKLRKEALKAGASVAEIEEAENTPPDVSQL